MVKYSLLIFVGLFQLQFWQVIASGACGSNWVQYGEEYCYQVVEKTVNWDQAKQLCEELDSESNSTLVAIRSKDVQDFIEDYLYNQKNVIDNVWIGAKRNDENSEFRWIDGTKLDYEHWRKNAPMPGNRNCLQIISELSNEENKNGKDEPKVGEWSNTECNRHNFATLCQKVQQVDLNRLSAIVFALREEFNNEKKVFKDTIAQMQGIESELKVKVNKLMEENVSLNKSLTKTTEELQSMKKNEKDMSEQIEANSIEIQHWERQVPINATLVQYPYETEPSKFWNCSIDGVWKDVTRDYLIPHPNDYSTFGPQNFSPVPSEKSEIFPVPFCKSLLRPSHLNDWQKELDPKQMADIIPGNYLYTVYWGYINNTVIDVFCVLPHKVWRCVSK